MAELAGVLEPQAALELQQLVLRERRARDRCWWDAMEDCYLADATVRLSWFEGTARDFVRQSERMTQSGTGAVHRLGPPVIDVLATRAVIEVPADVRIRTRLDGVLLDLVSQTRLLYRAERGPARWLLRSLDAVYEADTLTPSRPGAHFEVSAATLSRFRPPYRNLAYVFERLGYEVPDSLYGDDRAEPVAHLYQSLNEWLQTGGTDGQQVRL
jgi:hypothetical protein